MSGPAAGGEVAALAQQAVTAHQQGRLDAAEALYRQVLSIAPALLEVRHYYAILLQQSGRLEEALEWEQAVLDRLGFPTYTAIVMATSAPTVDHGDRARLEEARRAVAEAEAELAQAAEELPGSESPAAVAAQTRLPGPWTTVQSRGFVNGKASSRQSASTQRIASS